MATSDTTVRPLTDNELLDRVVPRWAQVLNWIYNHTFAPIDRLIDYLSGASTRKLVSDFEAAEAAKAKATQS